MSGIEVRIFTQVDASLLDHVAPDVFDEPIDANWSAEFLADSRHHLAAAIEDGIIVGIASAVHYVHPDKPPELWINEVGVAETHRRRGIARQLLQALFERGRGLGCSQAWVLADQSNTVAHRLYESAGGEAAPEPAIMFEFPLL
jgi:GNAT superfamily N-acetyltransferase